MGENKITDGLSDEQKQLVLLGLTAKLKDLKKQIQGEKPPVRTVNAQCADVGLDLAVSRGVFADGQEKITVSSATPRLDDKGNKIGKFIAVSFAVEEWASAVALKEQADNRYVTVTKIRNPDEKYPTRGIRIDLVEAVEASGVLD